MPDLFVHKPSENIPESKTAAVTEQASTPMNPFTAFCMYPKGLTFENQEHDEHIILFLRKAPILLLPWIITSVALFLVPPILAILWPLITPLLPTIPFTYLLTLTIFYYLLILSYPLLHFIVWFYHVGIITNQRVIDVDLVGISSKNVAATGIRDIVDVEYSQKGFFSSLFNFGDVHMQTEGLKANFEYTSVPKPAQVTDVISDLIRKEHA